MQKRTEQKNEILKRTKKKKITAFRLENFTENLKELHYLETRTRAMGLESWARA